MTSLNHVGTYAEKRGNDPKLFFGNDRSPWCASGAKDLLKQHGLADTVSGSNDTKSATAPQNCKVMK